MNLQIIQVPYDSGHKDDRMGKGPAHLASRMMQDDAFRGVQFEVAKVEEGFPLEVGTTFHVLKGSE